MQLSIDEFGDESVFEDKQMSVWSEGITIEWDDFILAQEDPFLDCGFPVWEHYMHDMDTALDPGLFTKTYDDMFFVNSLSM